MLQWTEATRGVRLFVSEVRSSAMKMRTFIFCFVVLALFGVAPGWAQQKATPAKAASQETMTEAVAQVDGISTSIVDQLWTETDVHWHHGDYYRIIDLCRVCVEAEPDFNEGYMAGAYLIWSLGDPKGADDLLSYGISRTPNKTELYADLGRHFNFTKRYPAAETYLKKAVSYPNAGPVAYAQLAYAYKQQKKYGEAVKVWEQVVKKFPTFPSGKANLDHAREMAQANDSAPKSGAKL